ncbi:MAG: hypothetical protein MZV70_67185 [Desulfobacterales bacterium]|nr:hypothetical protein [Desulfobacterales bacterium]
MLEQIEELLITADVGVQTATAADRAHSPPPRLADADELQAGAAQRDPGHPLAPPPGRARRGRPRRT